MPDFTISSLRGGMNDSDPPIALPNDQCVLAENAEFIKSMLGERRRGSTAVDISGSDLVGNDRITFLHRHTPTSTNADSELWALGVTGTASSDLCRKTTTWAAVSPVDAITLTGGYQYQLSAQSLHGKLFVSYKSGQDRLHVWDGSAFRRTGLAEPADPTAGDDGSGSFTGTRYYRIRYTVQSGGTTLRRSEPSNALMFVPSGSGSGVVVTKPASISESETHWELEASIDNANFYRIATTVVGTTTVTDTTAYNTGYALTGTLSEDIGDYSLIPSGRFLTADEDRLLVAGSFEDASMASRVSWTPVFNDPGDGNDERLPIDTDNFIDLDGAEGGALTGLSESVNGYIHAFKQNHIYRLVRTGIRTKAYEAVTLTKQRGALPGSIVSGVDQSGRPCIYFLDPSVGPCRIGTNGIQSCGADIRETWRTVNVNAANVIARATFYPDARQVHWWVATDDADIPNLRLVLQTNEMRDTADGARRGWSIWTGPSSEALAVCMFSDNIDDNTARNNSLRPFIGVEDASLIQRTDTGDDDNGTEYAARIVTKPYTPVGILHRFGVMAGSLLAKAQADASIEVKVTRDFGLEQHTVSADLDPTGSETHVIKHLDDLSFAELRVVQVEFADPDTPGERWELDQLALKERQEQTA